LHKFGECWRKPGVDFMSFEILGPELPPPTAYHAACCQCFNKNAVLVDGASSSSSSSEGRTAELGHAMVTRIMGASGKSTHGYQTRSGKDPLLSI
jgi:hypothetical protein